MWDLALGLTAFLFGIIYTFNLIEPTFWFGIQSLSQSISHFIGKVTGQPLLLSGTASGLFISLPFIIFGAVAFALSSQRKWRDIIVYTSGVLIANAVFIAGVHWPAQWIQRLASNIQVHPMNLLVFLLLLDGMPLYFFLRKRSFVPIYFNVIPVSWKGAVAGLLCFLVSVSLFLLPSISAHDTTKNIIIYNRGYFNWDKPVFGKYGLRSGGMFGMLPSYLHPMGYNVHIDSIFSPQSLEGVAVAVVINLNAKIPSEEKEQLQSFVHRGGSLLVMGDHTGLGGIMEPLNDLTEFVKIRFKFDCGHYLRNDWKDAFEFFYHPVFNRMKDEIDIGISIGASLDFSPVQAVAVLFAKYGFSDWGNPLNSQNAYLGDRMYKPGELLGDIVLVAMSGYGKGKVLVFGDTSPFQNGTLTYSFHFVQNVFCYLSQSEVEWMNVGRRVGVAFFLLLGLIFLFVFGKALIEPASVVWVIIGVGICGLAETSCRDVFTHQAAIAPSESPAAYIDAAHLNRFTQYGDDGIWALSYNLMRNDYLSFVHREFSPDALKHSKVAFFISPAKDLTSDEIQALSEYVHDGGVAVWSVGYEEKESSAAVLQRFGFQLDNVPLGPIPKKETSAGIQFHKAWPILAQGAERIDTLCTGWNYPVIVSKAIGKGRIILISDPGFLLSENLESDRTYSEANISFLRKILSDVRE